jgi:hypothetical protein
MLADEEAAMPNTSIALEPPSAGLTAWRRRLGNPLNWCNADKALLVALVVLPFAVWHVGLEYYYLHNPDAAPYIDVEFVRRTIGLQALVWVGGWATIAVAALVLRRRYGESRLCCPTPSATTRRTFSAPPA